MAYFWKPFCMGIIPKPLLKQFSPWQLRQCSQSFVPLTPRGTARCPPRHCSLPAPLTTHPRMLGRRPRPTCCCACVDIPNPLLLSLKARSLCFVGCCPWHLMRTIAVWNCITNWAQTVGCSVCSFVFLLPIDCPRTGYWRCCVAFAATLLCLLSLPGLHLRVVADLLESIMQEQLFDTLRTNEQLGWVASPYSYRFCTDPAFIMACSRYHVTCGVRVTRGVIGFILNAEVCSGYCVVAPHCNHCLIFLCRAPHTHASTLTGAWNHS